LIEWVGLATLSGFIAMGLDKLLAAGRRSRVSERTLWLICLIGGFAGIVLGGYVFRHKTSKMEFWGLVIASAIIWAVIVSRLSYP
jgi:uncharacterized membrane protein YsdA (DUF1294 family)